MAMGFGDRWLFSKGDGEWKSVNLPHDAMLEERRYETCANGKQCAFFPGGKYLYRKSFVVPKEKVGFHTSLLFEGVYRYATVKLNGKTVGTNVSGFSDFSVDLTGKIVEGENVLEVIADNTLVPNCRWYTGSGIYRPVHLIQKEAREIESLKVSTLSLSPARIRVEAIASSRPTVEIYDGQTLLYRGEPGDIELEGARLWNVDAPHLYTCVVKTEKDREETRFGIRTIELKPGVGLLVNGEKTLLRGGCVHSDNGILGACSYKEAEYRKVRILKEAGYNAIRCAHNPCSRFFLQACDELGMLVIDEAFDGWYIPKEYHDYARDFFADHESVLARMVAKDFNHPCVIMYSIGNEVSETAEEKGIALCGQMRDYVRSLDATRPVTVGLNLLIDVYAKMGFGIYRDKGAYKKEPLPDLAKKRKEKKSGSAFFNAMMQKLGGLMLFMSKLKVAGRIADEVAERVDVLGLNYGSSRYEIDAKKHPGRWMLGTETMIGDLPENWAKAKRIPGLIGDFSWAAWDYLGEAGVGDWTYYRYQGLPLLAGSGAIDLEGNITAECEFMARVWGLKKDPFIGVRPLNHHGEVPFKSAWRFTDCIASWNWQGFEKKKAVVEVYADAKAVCLSLNGKEIGKKKLKGNKALFKVRYAPGILKAVALDEAMRPCGERSLVSGADVILEAKPDKTKLKPGEIAFVPIKFVDENGQIAPSVEQPVTVRFVGESVALQGFGTARAKTDETFDRPTITSYRGSCLLAVRAGMSKGETKLRIESESQKPIDILWEVE